MAHKMARAEQDRDEAEFCRQEAQFLRQQYAKEQAAFAASPEGIAYALRLEAQAKDRAEHQADIRAQADFHRVIREGAAQSRR